MKKTVNEIAKDAGFNEGSFNEIFKLRKSEADIVDLLKARGLCCDAKELREKLEYAGKRCALYVGLIDLLEGSVDKAKSDIEQRVGDVTITEKWLAVIQTHRDVYEMMGFLTLLQMDAMTTTISLLQAQNDTERIVLSKHAYAIMYEARTHDLFDKVSAGMHNYPEEIVDKDELNEFWKEIKSVLKEMISQKESEDIRHKLDAHKDKSFINQISLYKRCDWSVSVANILVFIKIIDSIGLYMYNIHKKLNVLYDNYRVFAETRMKQYENILNQLKELP